MNDKDTIKLLKLKEQIRDKNNLIKHLRKQIAFLEGQLDWANISVDHWIRECENAESKEKALRSKLLEILKAHDSESSNNSDLPF